MMGLETHPEGLAQNMYPEPTRQDMSTQAISYDGFIDDEAIMIITALKDILPDHEEAGEVLTLHCDGQQWFVRGQHPSPTTHKKIEEVLLELSTKLDEARMALSAWLSTLDAAETLIVRPDDRVENEHHVQSPMICRDVDGLLGQIQRRLHTFLPIPISFSERAIAKLVVEGKGAHLSEHGWDIQNLERIANDTSYPARLTV